MRWFVALGVVATLAVLPSLWADRVNVAILDPDERIAQDFAGTWRNTIDGVGVSYWELSLKKDGAYDAQEFGMGSRRGTAKLKDGALVVQFEADGHKGVYTWTLNGSAGQGHYTQTEADGRQTMKHKSSVRFIGK